MYLKGRVRKGEIEIFHLLVDSPSGHSSESEARPKQEPGASAQPPTGTQGAKDLGHLLLLSQAHLQAAKAEVEQPELMAPYHRHQLHPLYRNAYPIDYFSYLRFLFIRNEFQCEFFFSAKCVL